MAEKQKPLKVLATHAYPAYQFVADFEYRDHDGDACFRYLILHILDWVCQRTEDDILIKSLGLPSPPDPDEAGESCFQSVHVSDAYKLDICALMAEGIWSMRLAEPDMDRAERRAVVGRSFVTNVGLTRKAPDSRLVTCGIRIDVLDPENAPEEVPFAYRPAFLRTLFIKGEVRVSQACYPVRREAIRLETEDSMRDVLALQDRPDTVLPALVITEAFDYGEIAHELEDIDAKLGLAESRNSILHQARIISDMPAELSHHLLCYGRVFAVPVREFAKLRSVFRLSEDFRKGDILLIEPKRFGRRCRVYRYAEEQARILQKEYFEGITNAVQTYSKRKGYPYDGVCFLDEAQQIERDKRIRRIREEQEKTTFGSFCDLLDTAEQDRDRMKEENERLKKNLELMEARLQAQKRSFEHAVAIAVPEDAEEYFPDEMRDLILTVLRNRDGQSDRTEETRATELLRRIVELEENRITGKGYEVFDGIEKILQGHKNLSEGDYSKLKRFGLIREPDKQGDGHIRLRFRGGKRAYTIAATGSDVRGLKNSCADIIRRESVYKV